MFQRIYFFDETIIFEEETYFFFSKPRCSPIFFFLTPNDFYDAHLFFLNSFLTDALINNLARLPVYGRSLLCRALVQIGHLEEAAGRLTGQRVSNEYMLVVLVVSLGVLIELYKDMLVYLGVVEYIRTCILLC